MGGERGFHRCPESCPCFLWVRVSIAPAFRTRLVVLKNRWDDSGATLLYRMNPVLCVWLEAFFLPERQTILMNAALFAP